ncbi:cryptochrome/photolyase family protein [Flavobacteriaceae bacterium TP-CH-4]|uniref:Cryptochrome/photolyase family protein n=1 Tax=Pelagihabitans pacificus TaxID=2696054 RepID=A0A967E701_9FLAO|nr:cryptochrome/photolyase family protein [Pelagihabitans pacificus]NHF61052.1 cryptochrome/photolyase family protein [Pelagihabitans pacificus]
MSKKQEIGNKINIIFPHQLFKEHPLLENEHPIYLVEEFLFFKQYPFHKQKIAYHRATMKFFEGFLKDHGRVVHYVETGKAISDVRKLIPFLKEQGCTELHYVDVTDYWLERRVEEACKKLGIQSERHDSPMWLNTWEDLKGFFKTDKKKYFQTSFYKDERVKRNILVDEKGNPAGGKWTYDTENRKKYPARKTPPPIQYPDVNTYYKEARSYVETNCSQHYGNLSEQLLYPTDYQTTEEWFQQFLENRFMEFGAYEDAIVAEETILNHSVLTPMLNVGLITPDEIVSKSLSFAEENEVPINSIEGFIRQIIGWREFIRGVYISRGRDERLKHFWGFTRQIPKSFYDGTTGIYPIDQTIKKVLKTGYCHHIERLMVLGNFMVLCEFDPDAVYRWFMELFIDAYDWVMVPNVYGMSQYADGGLMSTKPYISGSNYLMKMSDYKKGDWQEVWDGLFWRFMHTHRDFFSGNPRLSMLVGSLDRMSNEKRQSHLKIAEGYLESLDS